MKKRVLRTRSAIFGSEVGRRPVAEAGAGPPLDGKVSGSTSRPMGQPGVPTCLETPYLSSFDGSVLDSTINQSAVVNTYGKVGQEFVDFCIVVDNNNRGKGRGRDLTI